MNLTEKIRTLRENAGLTQAELAEAVGGNSFLPTVPVRIDYDKVSGR